MSRTWNELMSAEPTSKMRERVIEQKRREQGGMDVDLVYEKAKRPEGLLGEVEFNPTQGEKDVISSEVTFRAGGCKPEPDNEIKCKFNLGNKVQSKHALFTKPELDIEDADQTRTIPSKFERVGSGLAIVKDSKTIFCESKDGKLVCEAYKAPEDVLLLKRKTEKGVINLNNEITKDAEQVERVEADDIKFPAGGKVEISKTEDMVKIRYPD